MTIKEKAQEIMPIDDGVIENLLETNGMWEYRDGESFEDDDTAMMVFVCAALLELQERRKEG
jgi:hypothetical protein